MCISFVGGGDGKDLDYWGFTCSQALRRGVELGVEGFPRDSNPLAKPKGPCAQKSSFKGFYKGTIRL